MVGFCHEDDNSMLSTACKLTEIHKPAFTFLTYCSCVLLSSKRKSWKIGLQNLLEVLISSIRGLSTISAVIFY